MKNLPMSIQNMIKLTKENEVFTKRLETCQSGSEVINLLESNGITATIEELEIYKQFIANQALNDDDLDSVAGGMGYFNPTKHPYFG